jgi:hypothetical protein
LKAENTSLKTTNQRLLEKVAMLEEELDITRKEKNRLLQEEHDHYMKEIERLKSDHLAMIAALNEKNLVQNEEIQKLQVTKLNPSLRLSSLNCSLSDFSCNLER